MSRPSWYQKIFWTHFAKPAGERSLYKYLLQHPVSSILEVGVGDGQRMRRLAKLATAPDGAQVRYIGTDEFESAVDGCLHLTLKQAHQVAAQLGFKASLIPGDVQSAIPRVAHKLGASDLLIINGGLDLSDPTSGIVGSWLNRIAHQDSVIFSCENHGSPLQSVDTRRLGLDVASRAA